MRLKLSATPRSANNGIDPCETPDEAYFRVLQVRTRLRRQNPNTMPEDYYRRWSMALQEVESVLLDLRPYVRNQLPWPARRD
jgi:hypothetical protein